METLSQFKERIKSLPFNEAVKQEPHPDLIKGLPDKRVNSKGEFVAVRYMPIENVQMLLDLLSTTYEVEIIAQGSMFTSVFVTKRLRVEYCDIYGGLGRYKKISVDGIGAMAVNNLNPVRMMLPAASSLAETNAAKNLGELFGRNLNRDLDLEVVQEAAEVPKTESVKVIRIKKLIEACKSIEELNKLKSSSKPEFESYFKAKEDEFRGK